MYTAAPTRFPRVGHPSCPPLCCFSAPIRTFLAVPARLSEVHRHSSGSGRCLLLPFRRCSFPGSGLVPHSSSKPVIFCLFARWRPIGSPRMSWCSFREAWRLGARPVVPSACLRASFTVFAPPRSCRLSMAQSSTPPANALPASLFIWS
jgi:hypothetical protein